MIALVQRALQAAFMAVEARFNAFFGDRLNPFYHLGAISFFLFWIVAGSGVTCTPSLAPASQTPI